MNDLDALRCALTPPDCDLRDFPRMMIDIQRLRGSGFDAITDDSAWRAGVNLWLTAWHQVPAASLDDDEASLAKAAGLGRDLRTWRKVQDLALKGWVRCQDGRLYHETIAEIALEAWIEKLGRRLSSGAGNANRYGREFDPAPVNADIAKAAELLTAINPKSKALSRQHVVKASTGTPIGVPPGPKKPPAGSPPGSQEKRREGNIGSEDKSSGVQDAEPDLDKAAWDSAVQVLTSQGGMAEKAARAFFGKLLSSNGLRAKELLAATMDAKVTGTLDPQGYLTRLAQVVGRRQQGRQAPKQVGFV
jgi:hypothetical protein